MAVQDLIKIDDKNSTSPSPQIKMNLSGYLDDLLHVRSVLLKVETAYTAAVGWGGGALTAEAYFGGASIQAKYADGEDWVKPMPILLFDYLVAKEEDVLAQNAHHCLDSAAIVANTSGVLTYWLKIPVGQCSKLVNPRDLEIVASELGVITLLFPRLPTNLTATSTNVEMYVDGMYRRYQKIGVRQQWSHHAITDSKQDAILLAGHGLLCLIATTDDFAAQPVDTNLADLQLTLDALTIVKGDTMGDVGNLTRLCGEDSYNPSNLAVNLVLDRFAALYEIGKGTQLSELHSGRKLGMQFGTKTLPVANGNYAMRSLIPHGGECIQGRVASPGQVDPSLVIRDVKAPAQGGIVSPDVLRFIPREYRGPVRNVPTSARCG